MANPSRMVFNALVRLNNRITRWRRVHTEPQRVLVLLAHCLQCSACGRNITRDAHANCVRCGRCTIGPLLELADRTGVRLHVAGGGRQALAAVKADGVVAVVAVACERELMQGILGVFPTPVFAVCNTRPLGDCHDTQVDIAAVEAAVRQLTEKEDKK